MRKEVTVVVHEGPYNLLEVGYGPCFLVNKSKRDWNDILGTDTEELIDDESIIFVPADFFDDWKTLTEDDIRTLLWHELGHSRTWEQLTDDLMEEERFRDILFELITAAHPVELTSDEFEAEYEFFRHQLPSERIASESVGITMDDIRHVFTHQFGIEPVNKFDGVDVQRLLTKPVDIDYGRVTRDNIVEVIVEFASDIVTDEGVLVELSEVARDWFERCEE